MPTVDIQQALGNVLRHPAIWRAQQVAHGTPGIPTGYSALDQVLPERGWPAGALTELLVKVAGAGELSLLMPALRATCAEGRGIALVAPPWLPHARAWEAAGIPLEHMLVVDSDGIDLLWAAEQILRSGECGAVLVWGQGAGRALNNRALQRLHLAANTGNAACFLYRSVGAEANPSPAPLRLRLEAHAGTLQIHIVKCRGAIHAKPTRVQLFPAHWHVSPAQAGTKTPLAVVAPRGNASDAKILSGASRIPDAAIVDHFPAKTSAESLRAMDSSALKSGSANTSSEVPRFSAAAYADPFLAKISRASLRTVETSDRDTASTSAEVFCVSAATHLHTSTARNPAGWLEGGNSPRRNIDTADSAFKRTSVAGVAALDFFSIDTAVATPQTGNTSHCNAAPANTNTAPETRSIAAETSKPLSIPVQLDLV